MERKRGKERNCDLRVQLLKKMYIKAKIAAKDPATLQQIRGRNSCARPASPSAPIKCLCKADETLETLYCELHRWTMMREVEKPNSSLTSREKITVQRRLAEYKTRSEQDWQRNHHQENCVYRLPGLSRFGVEAFMPAKRRIDVDPRPKSLDRWGLRPLYKKIFVHK